MRLHPAAPGLAHAPGPLGIGQGLPQRLPERGGVTRLHQPAGLAVHHHLGDAPDPARHHRRAAGHGLEVDQAERLVDGRADEDRGVTVELDDLGNRQHRVDPADLRTARHRGLEAGQQLRRVRAARAEHELDARGQGPRGLQEREDPLLLADPAHEEHVGGAHPVAREGIALLGAREGLRVHPVVDHHHPVGIDPKMGRDVGAHLGGHRDDAIGALDGQPLGPARHRVAGAELIGLPRPERLHAVQRDDERDVVDGLHQHPTQPHVPGVGVHHVGHHRVARHRESHRERLERGRIGRLRSARQARPRSVAPDGQVRLRLLNRERQIMQITVAEAAHLHRRAAGERAAQVIHHHAGAPVDVRRVLAAQEQDSHRRRPPGELTA